MSLDSTTRDQIGNLVKRHRVLLFMKGNREAPQCGFSQTVVGILDRLVPSYATFDVLSDQALREGIKEFSDWPTIPQLYIAGEFVGGCDIVQEMYGSGELHESLGLAGPEALEPKIQITDAAAEALKRSGESAPGSDLHLSIDARFQYSLGLGPRRGGEIVVSSNGFTILLDPESARRADGMTLDLREGKLSIQNPNEPVVQELSVSELRQWLGESRRFAFYDVRTEDERARAKIDGATLLDADAAAELEELDRTIPLVFHCHHGGRSHAAAQHYAALGFTVYNVVGGIDAWSREVDPSVPRY